MTNELFDRLERQFYRYTEMYDANIINLFKQRNTGPEETVLRQILDEAKHLPITPN